MTKLRLALVILLSGSVAVLGYQHYQQHRNAVRAEAATQEALKRFAEFEAVANRSLVQRENDFVDRSTTSAIPRNYPRPVSEWTANEKRFYEKILTANQYDVLVAPLQVNGWAFDRASRSLMTAELTASIAKSLLGKVPDPYLVAKVFGDGQRQYPREELYRIANAVGAKRIIWGAVGHDLKGKMAVTIMSQLRPEVVAYDGKWPTPIDTHTLANLAFDTDRGPIRSFELQLPVLLRLTKIDPVAPNADKLTAKLDMTVLPASPLDLSNGSDNPARDAYSFLLFGLLTPQHMERTKERFAEKAILALSRLSESSPEYKALLARAYLMMGYRAEALKILGAPQSGEEQEILADLNGNLPEVRAQASAERNPLKRLIAQLDANRIAAAYGVLSSSQSVASVKALNLPGSVWPMFADRAFTDWDPWSQFDNASLKALLDRELPLQGYGLEEIMRAAASLGDTNKIQTLVDLSVFNHSQTFLQTHSTACCDPNSVRFFAADYMDFLASLGHDNLIRRIASLTDIQRRNRAAIGYADSIQSIYKGYPYYTLVRSEAERAAADESTGAEREGLVKLAYEDAFNAMYWEQTQSLISSRALTDLGSSFRQHQYGYFDNFYYTDLPYHPLYMKWGGGGNPATVQANAMAGLDNATYQIDAVIDAVGRDTSWQADEPMLASLVNKIQGRFAGSPKRAAFLADQEVSHGNVAAAETLLRQAIKTAPTYRQSYLDLGQIMLESGEANSAAKIFMSYPGLRQDLEPNRVSVANAAYQMGSYFFHSGDLDLATPFYSIASSQETGAGSEMASTMRLKILGGDINGATLSALERAQRYHDPWAYRDYLSMLHATKHSQDAWAGFNTLVGEDQNSDIWESALVGHHMAGSTEAEVTGWAKQADFRMAGNHVSYAIAYLARFATIDRIPSKEMPSVIADLDRPTWQFETGSHSVVRPNADGREQPILGPAGAITPQGILPIGVFDNGGPKHRVRPALSYFVEGYRAIKLRDFKEAKRLFDEAATIYDMASYHSTYMLPYYALASIKAGADISAIEGILDRIEPRHQLFEYQLAKAVLKTANGNIHEALVSLKLARYRRPYVEEGVELTEFAYADICESLYHMTSNTEIRDMLLAWAKSREKAEPWHSWNYALEASLTLDPSDRKRALAMTYYLDPKSAHLSSFKKSEINDAVKTFGSANIFLKKELSTGKGRTST